MVSKYPPMPEPPNPVIHWPHAPPHRLGTRGTYFVTARTYQKALHFKGRERLEVLHRGLLNLAHEHQWRLLAWAVFCNHYHFVAESPSDSPDAQSLGLWIGQLHERTAKWINRLDGCSERKVWHNFRETLLTFDASLFARLNYTHQNPVRHGLVAVANQYPWCSAAWFEREAPNSFVNTIYKFKMDKVNVEDDFEISGEW